jgi:hypothetical protein
VESVTLWRGGRKRRVGVVELDEENRRLVFPVADNNYSTDLHWFRWAD